MFNALGPRDVEEGAIIPFSAYNQTAESSNVSQPIAARNDQDTASLLAQPAVAQPTNCYGIPGNCIGRKPENGGNAVEPMHNVAPCLTKTNRHGVAQPIAFGWQNSPSQGDSVSNDVTPTLDKSKTPAVAVDVYNQTIGGQVTATLTEACGGTNTSGPKLMQNMAVRRLTPVECERLQGFPDNYTQIPWRKKEPENCPDGPRYKALGNSMAVPVMRWIGKRIAQVEAMQ
jgi:DNA (cytosine-5)-methyltransferase 1